MDIWHEMPDTIPDDEETVWVRRPGLAHPFLATYFVDTQQFTTDEGLNIPWWAVSRWRHQT